MIYLNTIYRELMEQMMTNPGVSVTDQANHLLWAAHNLERYPRRSG